MADSRANFTVSGVESESDARSIEERLGELEGVQMAVVDDGGGQVEVRYGEELLSEKEIEDAVRDLGYEVE